jgi:hypothetical protein
MPRLLDLLRYVAQPTVEHVWLLLDIKVGTSVKIMDILVSGAEPINHLTERQQRPRFSHGPGGGNGFRSRDLAVMGEADHARSLECALL